MLQTNFNLSISFAMSGALHVTVPIQYSDKLCGMCGNFNTVMDDDKNMPDISLIKDTQILGQKFWANSLCQEPIVSGMCSESEKLEYASKMYCGVLMSQNGPFSKCSSSLDTSSLFRSCISEMCTAKGDHEAFCNVLQAVEKSCSERGKTFMEADCKRLCTCVGHGNIECSATSCLAHEVCKVKNGAMGCFPSSPVTCSVYGDPHYITFDGKAYSFQGTCNYTIAKTCSADAVQFTLTARNEGLKNYTSSLNSVVLNVDGLHLAIRKSKLVYVNGSQITLPFLHNTSVSVSQAGPYVIVETNFGLRVLFNGNDRLFVQVDERQKGRICINGSQNKPACSPELDNNGFQECSKLFGDAFKACHWFVPPQIFVNSCVQDYCTSGGDQSQLCTSLQNYVATCEVSEVFLGDWWKGTVCDVPTTPPTVEPSTLTPSQPTTPNSSAICRMNCNFDNSLCTWTQLLTDVFNWTRHRGPTPTSMTGPLSDHTTGTGYYVYIEGDSASHGDTARLLSEECSNVQPQCLQFWYHIYGSSWTMGLSVYLLHGNVAQEVWRKRENQGNTWHQALVDITPHDKFMILFEGRRGDNARSDVALDDISMHKGSCADLINHQIVSPIPGKPTPIPTVTSATTKPASSLMCTFNCNFDNSLCTWSQLATDVFDWTRHSGPTSTAMTGPPSDHTTGTGYYLYIEGDSASHGDTARLLSDECSDVQPQCLQFWYHIYGSSWTMGLSVYLLHGNVAQEVWRKRENQGNTWHQALVDITPHGKFMILFEGRRGDNAQSDVALDDISMHKGSCADLIKHQTVSPIPGKPTLIPTVTSATTKSASSLVCTFNCNFDNSLCTWSQLATDVFDWTRHSGPTSTAMTGPQSDHTTGTGYYLYIEGDSAAHGDTARLLSEECSDVQPHCLQFWYHMYGSSWTMGLSVYLLHGNVAQEVWRKRENQGNVWHQALVDIMPHGKFRILFEGRRGHSDRSDVALDDVSLHRGPCAVISTVSSTTTSPQPSTKNTRIAPVQRNIPVPVKSNFSPGCRMNCSFDYNLCTWTQLLTDVFDWTRQQGSTPTSKTGPSFDHTTGAGYYLYIEGDSASHGDTARLLSEECSDVQPQCLQFWYHIYGSSWTMGLSVYLLHGNVAQEVWRKRENQGNTWHQALVDITPHGKFMILFEGRRGDNARSDVALDDISIHKGSCADLIKHPTVSPIPGKQTLIPTVTSATTKSVSSLVCTFNCNFDNSLCTWSQLATDVFDWTRHSGPTSTAMTGPPSDHTTGTGYYLYIEGDSAAHGDTARLLSEECSDVQPQCLQFWYHMYGSSWTMGLSVYLLHGNVAQEVWRKRENQGNVWHQALVDITPHGKFRILFEGRRGHSDRSDVALDDVSLHRGPCAGLLEDPIVLTLPEISTVISTVSSTTTSPQPSTKNTRIAPVQRNIPVPVKSNFSPGCRMNCSFDYNLCTWTQLLTDVFDWTRQQGSTPTSMTGPSFDHTTGAGYYLYIEGDSASHGDTARLLSEECSDVQPQCLQFWYHIYGSSWTMGLSVYLLHGNVAQEVWRKRENQGNTWHQALVDITPHGKFMILFEGRRGDNARSDVALDDISMHKGSCADLIKHPTVSPIPGKPTLIPTVTSAATKSASSLVCTFNCNFDNSLCTWSQLATDVFDWTRHSGPTSTAMTGPPSDHTTGTGYYLYIEGDSAAHGDTARLLSEECSDVQPQCLQFWYHMYGSSWTMGLSVYLLHGNVAQEVWRKRENQGNVWHQALVDITPHGKFRILFEGRRGHSDRSDVALDDVSLHRGPCAGISTVISTVSSTTTFPQPSTKNTRIAPVQRNIPVPVKSKFSPGCRMNCSFDYNLCTWTQLLTDVFDWTRQQGSTPTSMTGPSFDHTTGAGYYLYIEGDSASHGDTARLLSEECSDVQPQCLQFWYHIYGSSWTMGLSVYLLHGNVAQEVWRKRENQGNTWHQALVDITPHGKFMILFEGRRGDNARSDVALDDISMHKGSCADLIKHPTVSPIPGKPTLIPTVTSATTKSASSLVCTFNCNFDNSLCTWSQLATDVFDWTRQQGSTPTSMTGPSFDHTTGAGYYLYIEGDSASHGDTARLLSEECSDVQPQCLLFWYHIYGSSWTMGLSVYLLHGNVAQEVWRKRENQGNTWHQALVDIMPHGKFMILFEGRRGDNARSDVALDDISMHKGSCADLINHQTVSPIPGNPALITTVTSATTKSASSLVCTFNCNFDNSLCTWSQLATDVFDWTRHSGPTSTAMTGPPSDHTTGTGYYLYIEGDSAAHGDTARLLSEECSDVQPQCLQFWYHMYGSSWTMGLSVYLLHGNVAQEVWRKREDQGNIWHQVLVDIMPHGKFRILFEGRRGHNARSDVAMDDVFIHKGTCAGIFLL
ncbi:MAM and LDL-receptor class A domain-containing protein 1-like [Neoarius graeffei]|uniref:MAM and LDL-receptor class A domain-containing protein 1-like n=1 Tax=Neoarius graeffei TaxID=443677 RepID=UPI00298D18AD|nr:MAM and LDL-receptor class A domain-containing protein 1-like [Neoarius graeffei]